ncbi:MAG: class I SAM-dependent methyltransferase [Caldilineaceae bacterium]
MYAAGALLDVGCAAGTFLLAMSHWGLDGNGVELNAAEVARQTRERYGLDVIAGTLEDAHLAPAQFDAVTMWDVLEHVYDPAQTLREIHRLLKPGGIRDSCAEFE